MAWSRPGAWHQGRVAAVGRDPRAHTSLAARVRASLIQVWVAVMLVLGCQSMETENSGILMG
jgi:hypothetical protein